MHRTIALPANSIVDIPLPGIDGSWPPALRFMRADSTSWEVAMQQRSETLCALW